MSKATVCFLLLLLCTVWGRLSRLDLLIGSLPIFKYSLFIYQKNTERESEIIVGKGSPTLAQMKISFNEHVHPAELRFRTVARTYVQYVYSNALHCQERPRPHYTQTGCQRTTYQKWSVYNPYDLHSKTSIRDVPWAEQEHLRRP